LRKSKVEDSSSSKYVPPHMRHIKGKGNIVCKNANHISVEKVKQHSNKRSLPICHHCGIIGHIRPKCPHLQAQKSKVQKELPTRATSDTLPPTAFQAPRHQQQQLKLVPVNQSGKSKKNKSRCYKRKPQKPISNHGYEWLLSLMQCMLRIMDNMNKTCKPPPRVKYVWVKNDETIHSLRGSGLT
jgi:hypothetical protein